MSANLGFTYIDIANVQMVTCSFTQCTVDSASSALSGYQPVSIAQHGNELAVADSSCAGEVWTGTTSSLTPLVAVGDSQAGIAFSNLNPWRTYHLYVGDAATCSGHAARFLDITGIGYLPTPFVYAQNLIGLDSHLQYSVFFGSVYVTVESRVLV